MANQKHVAIWKRLFQQGWSLRDIARRSDVEETEIAQELFNPAPADNDNDNWIDEFAARHGATVTRLTGEENNGN